MDIKRTIATVLLGAGVGLTGCQSATTGGLAFWNKGDSGGLASATPDVSQQKFDGLSRGLGQPGLNASPGAAPSAADDNFLMASWKKTTAAVGGTLAGKPPADDQANDPLRLDRPIKKVGPEVHVAAARLLESQNKYAEAQAQYEKALQIAPRDQNALVGLARLNDRQGKSREAVELYQKTLKAHPASSLVHNDLGLCYTRQGQLDAAVQHLAKAVELQPDNSKYRNNLATVLVEMGRTEEALTHLTATSTPAVAHYNVGYLLLQKGEQAEAMRHCQQALALDPGLSPAREMLATLGGNFGAQPLAAQQGPQSAPRATASGPAPRLAAAPFAPQPVPSPAWQVAPQPVPPYDAGATGNEIYTTAPQLPPAAMTAPPQYHIGDDGPAAHTASRGTAWDVWSAGDQAAYGTMQPLPPVE